jgi:serine/alanine racemase
MERTSHATGRAWIELDMANLRHNVNLLRDLLPPDCVLMPAVKANAYGHGAILMAREMNRLGIRAFCVASVDEAAELRRNGIEGEILVLGCTPPEQFPLLAEYHLIQTVLDFEYAKLLNSFGRPLEVHVAADTGMRRIGERSENVDNFLAMFRMRNLRVTGLYTHLCTDDSPEMADRVFTARQAAAFVALRTQLHSCGYDPKVHLLSSYSLLSYPELGGAYARVGLALYGVLSRQTDLDRLGTDLRPVLALKARVIQTKALHTGEGVGYGLAYVADRERRIAVISIGYADGVPRSLSCGNGRVLIRGKSAPILGRVCMDLLMVDITGIDCKSGDIAVVIGRSGEQEITVYELARESGTLANELLSRLGSRLERVTRESSRINT